MFFSVENKEKAGGPKVLGKRFGRLAGNDYFCNSREKITMQHFIVIGITDHPEPYFTPEVLQIISSGRVFSGGRRHHAIVGPLLPSAARWIDIAVPLDAVFEAYAAHAATQEGRQGEPVIVFASGDPLFFGFANTIRRRLPEAHVVVYPTFNSLQMLAHRLLMPYHDMRIVSLTGRPWPEFDRALIEGAPKIGVLTDRDHTPAAIARRMLDYGYTSYNMFVGEQLGNAAQERVTTLTLGEAARRHFAMPNCLMLVQAGALRPRPFALRTPSTPKSNYLIFRIDCRVDAKWYNASRHRVSDVYIKHDWQLRSGDDAYQQLPVFFRISVVHRFSDQHAGNGLKHSRSLEVFKRAPEFGGRRLFFARFQQQDPPLPVLQSRKQMILFAEHRHVKISLAVKDIIDRINTAAEDFAREHRRPL